MSLLRVCAFTKCLSRRRLFEKCPVRGSFSDCCQGCVFQRSCAVRRISGELKETVPHWYHNMSSTYSLWLRDSEMDKFSQCHWAAFCHMLLRQHVFEAKFVVHMSTCCASEVGEDIFITESSLRLFLFEDTFNSKRGQNNLFFYYCPFLCVYLWHSWSCLNSGGTKLLIWSIDHSWIQFCPLGSCKY